MRRAAALSVLLPFASLAQDFLQEHPKWILRSMGDRIDTHYTVIADSTSLPQLLRIQVDGPHPFTATYRFRDTDWNPSCDSIEYRYTCSPCFDSLVARELADRDAEWLRLGPDRYMKARSRSGWRPTGGKWFLDGEVLQVHRTPGDPQCGTLIYSLVRMPKREFKEQVKRLRKARMHHPYWGAAR